MTGLVDVKQRSISRTVNCLCLTSQLERPSTRYRLLQYLPYFQAKGIEAEVVVVPSALKRWQVLLGKGVRRCQGIFIQKKLFSRTELTYLRYLASRCQQKIIYDFDDAVMHGRNPQRQIAGRRARRFQAMVVTADLLLAGNHYLYAQVNSDHADKVKIVPTTLDVSQYPRKDYSRAGNELVLGWLGTRSTLGYLRLIEPVLEKIIERYPQVRIKVVSDEKPGFEIKRLDYEQWRLEKETEQLTSFDIGLMPLPDDPWAKGKCGFKLIQYLAVGIPAVASAVGVNSQIVQTGVNGFLANTFSEWEDKLARLISSADLRRQFGQAGRKTVKENYDLNYWGPRVAEMIRELLAK